MVDYVNNLIQEMNAPCLPNFVSTFQTDAAAISAATCSNISPALTQLSNDLASLSAVLTSPAAFPFNLTLIPNSATVSLTIGGVPAQVTYAGGAPGYPAGLMQINAVIPSTIPPNVATQVVLTIGSANSQPGTTIALH